MRARQSGIALITALLVLALAVVLAAALTQDGAMSLRRTENLLHHAQAKIYLQGAEDWARVVLARDKHDVDHLGEAWALPLPSVPVEGGEISGNLIDLQGRFNLNALLKTDNTLDPIMQQRLRCILDKAGNESPEAALDALADWQDADSEVRPQGAEDEVYRGRPRPYRAGNQSLQVQKELLLIQGFTAEQVRALRPWVAALPPSASLNLNTAPLEVLSCLDESGDASLWETFVAEREKTPLKDVNELLGKPPFEGRVNTQGLGVNSKVYLLEAEAQVGRTRLRRYSMLLVDEQGLVRVWSRFQETL
ncbi:MAG: type II secretion system minor pseudopilin GspK [Halothiobacillaceae bacterium]|nr:type II secretion system minor pseudopilin GspK [Halothiobacillaceae bacterium]